MAQVDYDDEEEVEVPFDIAFNFNPDPEWQAYIQRYEKLILQIALKKCSYDEGIREDVMQEARIALATVFPEKIHGYAEYQSGQLTEQQWEGRLKRYCGNVIRNSILSALSSYTKGPWNMGRTRPVKDSKTGETIKVHYPPRYSSLDELVDEYGMQLDSSGNITWPEPSDSGLLPPSALARHYGVRARNSFYVKEED